jgi:uncharacterized membrane protein YfcA
VGTDLVQAVPLVGSAALGHILFGEFQVDIAGWLLVGAVPACYLGARCSASAPDHVIRPALVVVLVASGLKLLGVPAEVIGAGLALVGVAAAARVVARTRSAAAERADAVEGPRTPAEARVTPPGC